MDPKLTFRYDREADILYIDKRPPYPEQESEELGDDVIARLHPTTDEVENLEILFFSTRLLRSGLFELPLSADLRLAAQARSLLEPKATFNHQRSFESPVPGQCSAA